MRRLRGSRGSLVLIVWSAALAAELGCQDGAEIQSYSVPKERPVAGEQAVAEELAADRMLAAMVPHGDRMWFFKVTGPAAELDGHAKAFQALVESVRFSAGDSAEPEWTVPEGWRQLPASGMRFATLQFGSKEAPLELTVIPLPAPQSDRAAYVLSNVNRWRGQLGLAAITEQELAGQTERLELAGAEATIVSLLGTRAAAGRKPPPGHPPMTAPVPGPSAATAAAPSPLTYDVPDGWVQGRVGGMRKAAFSIQVADRKAEMTVIDLAAAAGDLLPNVNRWRGQVQLDELDQTALDQLVKTVEVSGHAGHYVELVGPEDADPREAILGVVVMDAAKVWFFKLKGDAQLVLREKQHFESFVRSVRFRSDDGAGNGDQRDS